MKRYRRFITLTASLLMVLLPKMIVNACGFYVAPGEYRFWLLQPDLANSKDLSPFFFASTYLYKGDQYAVEQSYFQKNIEEWYTQVNGKASKPDIDTLLNYTNPQLFLDEQKKIATKNSFLRYLLQPGNKELYQYFLLSKKVEDIAAIPDPWGERTFPLVSINKAITEALSLVHKTKSSFIKLRSAYQLIRLYGYNDQTDQIGKTYDSLIRPVKTSSWIRSAALYGKAISSTSARDYLLSKVFDRGDYNRVSCLVRFNSLEYEKTLVQAKNKHERTVITAMKVFNYPGRSLTYLRKIYKVEPTYKELPFLLLREINKVEDWLVTGKVTNFPPAVANGEYYHNWEYDAAINYHQDVAYGKQLYAFIEQLIREKKNKNIALLHLYAAHLSMLQNNFSGSAKHLSAVRQKGLPANVKTQLRLNKFLLRLQMDKTVSNSLERDFLSIIKTPDSKLAIHDPALMKDQLILFTARKMIQKGEKAKGLMLLSKTRRALGKLPIGQHKNVYQEIEEVASAKDYDGILEILSSKHKTPFEKFVSGGPFSTPLEYYEYYDDWDTTRWDKNKVLDGKASWFINHNNLKAALQTLQQMSDSFFSKEPQASYIGGNPFYVNVYRAHSISPIEKLNLNKKEVIREMIRLQDMANRTPAKAAECYYKLANAWYNMSYYGKNWLMVKQWWTSDDVSTYNKDLKRTAFNDVYFGCTKANEYYLKAMKQTKDKKLAALCCFMAGQCNNNLQRYKWTVKNGGKDNGDFSSASNPYIKLLKQKRVEKSYYDEVVKECETYTSYVRKYSTGL